MLLSIGPSRGREHSDPSHLHMIQQIRHLLHCCFDCCSQKCSFWGGEFDQILESRVDGASWSELYGFLAQWSIPCRWPGCCQSRHRWECTNSLLHQMLWNHRGPRLWIEQVGSIWAVRHWESVQILQLLGSERQMSWVHCFEFRRLERS